MPKLIAIGSSTGGPQALQSLFAGLKGDFKLPILITQHMPPTFTQILAEHITKISQRPCVEAEDGMAVTAGGIYVAPGDFHMTVRGDASNLVLQLDTDPPENFCRPAVDPMLRSLVPIMGDKLLVVILTGMGHDGLDGAEVVVEKGGTVIAQDEESSVVWGMPGAVAMAGLCSAVLPLKELTPEIKRLAGSR